MEAAVHIAALSVIATILGGIGFGLAWLNACRRAAAARPLGRRRFVASCSRGAADAGLRAGNCAVAHCAHGCGFHPRRRNLWPLTVTLMARLLWLGWIGVVWIASALLRSHAPGLSRHSDPRTASGWGRDDKAAKDSRRGVVASSLPAVLSAMERRADILAQHRVKNVLRPAMGVHQRTRASRHGGLERDVFVVGQLRDLFPRQAAHCVSSISSECVHVPPRPATGPMRFFGCFEPRHHSTGPPAGPLVAGSKRRGPERTRESRGVGCRATDGRDSRQKKPPLRTAKSRLFGGCFPHDNQGFAKTS